MAKPLTRPQPASSVAGMLQPGIGAQALARPTISVDHLTPLPVTELRPTAKIHVTASLPQNGEVPDISRQFMLTESADRALKRIVQMYSSAASLELKNSEFLRAVLLGIEHAFDELEREARTIGRLKRPKNDRGREAEREELERKIARALVAGFRATGNMSS